MSRTRLIRPGFFGDEEIAVGLSRDSRLAYIGLWTECDDAGYFEARPRQLARALFGYDADGLEVVERALQQLVTLGSVELLDCGVHGVVPTMPIHGQKGGNKAFNHRSRHEEGCKSEQVRTPTGPVRTPDARSTPEPVRTSPDKSSSESVSDSESGSRRKKKDVLDEAVEAVNGAREVDPEPFLSDPNRAGRRGASRASPPARSTLTVPPALAAVTPEWRHVCTDYVRHQSRHRLVDGVAVCDTCEEAIAAAAVEPSGLWPGPVQ